MLTTPEDPLAVIPHLRTKNIRYTFNTVTRLLQTVECTAVFIKVKSGWDLFVVAVIHSVLYQH